MFKRLICISVLLASVLFSLEGFAAPGLLALSETDNGQVQTWWPNHYGVDSAWIAAFEKQGISLIHPAAITDAPRLSPTVYSPKPLTDANARTLASLFGAQNVLTGNVTWACSSQERLVRCTADASLKLLFGKNGSKAFHEQLEAEATTMDMAKNYIMTTLVSHLALQMKSVAKTKNEIPALIDKPVIIFDPLPDADTLVALRKQLKLVPGVEDIAERWVADGVLAIEINPAQKNMAQSDFLQIIQSFMSQNVENLVVRETRSSDRGVVFEIVKY